MLDSVFNREALLGSRRGLHHLLLLFALIVRETRLEVAEVEHVDRKWYLANILVVLSNNRLFTFSSLWGWLWLYDRGRHAHGRMSSVVM